MSNPKIKFTQHNHMFMEHNLVFCIADFRKGKVAESVTLTCSPDHKDAAYYECARYLKAAERIGAWG